MNKKIILFLLINLMVLLTLACSFSYDLQSTPQSEVISVCAEQGWTNTGIQISEGDFLKITYLGGKWSPWKGELYDAIGSGGDPRCRCNVIKGVSHAALIGRIGDYNPFLVGEQYLHKVGENGELFLGINDVDISDNDGCLNAEVEIR